MTLISFKNLKLFKGPASSARQEKQAGLKEEKIRPVVKFLQNPFVFIVLFALALAYFISYMPAAKSLPQLKPGEIAPADILAPADLTIDDLDTTETRRREAVQAVLPVYVFDPNVVSNTHEEIQLFFLSGREWLKTAPAQRNAEQLQKLAMDRFGIELAANEIAALARENFSPDLETVLGGLIDKYAPLGIILSKSLFIQKETERGFILVRNQEGEKIVRPGDILDVKEAKDQLILEINKLDLPARKKGLLISLSFAFIAPNVTYNKLETDARRERAQADIEKVFYRIKKGKIIIRKGDEATEDAIKQIRMINQVLATKRAWLAGFIGTFLLFSLLFVTLWFYLKSLLNQQTAYKYFLMMGLTLILSLLIYKVFSFIADISSQNARFFLFTDLESYKYAFPFQFGVILFAFLTTNVVALIYAILNSLLIGYLFNASYFLQIFSLIGGLAAIYGIKFYGRERRTSTLRAGFFLVSSTNLFVILTLYLIKETWVPLRLFTTEMFMGLTGGLLGAAFAFVLLPIYENAFRFVTQTKLLELTSSETEIFRQLALVAPGSYHHSLIVASLAEKAAEAIRLDSLFVKAGALYHDIGKIKMPEYFIENKNKKVDVHKDLTPSMSTLVIINHVKEGVEIAKKEKLPVQIRDIIEQHHGSSLVRYFYQKAKEKYDPEMQKIGEESYRYPGPPPQSKEAALIMLADSVEAASRSLKVHKEENLKRVIRDIFDNYLQDGQLDDCNFSLKELRTIAGSFLATLQMVYQPRVEYPGFDFELKQKKKSEKDRNKDHDRDIEPTESGQN
jgi:putative nucleotidyltransferase with HDIG domain